MTTLANYDPVVHIRYKIGAREADVPNVNLSELRQLLAVLVENNETQEYVSDILGIGEAEFKTASDAAQKVHGEVSDADVIIDLWIAAMMESPPRLQVQEDTMCKTQFNTDRWRSRTSAASVVCLLEKNVEIRKEADKSKVTQQTIQYLLQGGEQLTTTSTSDLDKEAEAYIKRYYEEHP